MSSVFKADDGQKWINFLLAISAVLICYIVISALQYAGDLFLLEAKVKNFKLVAQGIGVLIAVTYFLLVRKHKQVKQYLDEVYAELVKVVWPEKDSVVKMTVGLVIAISIISSIFVLVDVLVRKVFSFLY